jgi:hypothetical protein
MTLDIHARTTDLGPAAPAAAAPASTRTRSATFGTFAITFGIAFAIIYTVFERMNWPLFTYHPAVGRIDFWMEPPRRGEGPPMYWYGWLALALPTAVVVAWLATIMARQTLYRTTLFVCVLALLWQVLYVVGFVIADRASFDAEILKEIWVSAIPAVLGAAAVTYLASAQWVERSWTGWLLLMPIGALVVLGYSLKSYFLR